MSEKLPASAIDQLREAGWAKLSCLGDSKQLGTRMLELANLLGEPIGARIKNILFETLKPTEKQQAHARSLSQLHATGSFPLHTDTAHWPTPCRYVLLGCEDPGEARRATVLLDTFRLPIAESEREILYTEPFRVINGRGSFFTTIMSSKRRFLRFDPGCMRPIDHSGMDALKLLSEARWPDKVIRHLWYKGEILIIDNWRVVHGRDSASTNDESRKLIRILVQ